LAQDADGNFVFVVRPGFRAWASSRERAYAEAAARFLTPAEAVAAAGSLVWIWPTLEIEPEVEEAERSTKDED
jgi:hypothetical protein